MSARKIACFLLCAVFLFFFGKDVVTGTVGLCAKSYFRWSQGSHLRYDSLLWQEEGFVFTNLIVDKPKEFSGKASRVVVSVVEKQIHFESPEITVLQWRELQNQGTFDWKIAVVDGSLHTPQLENISFSCECDLSSGEGKAFFALGSAAWVDATFSKGAIDLECERFPLSFFPGSEHSFWSGIAQGSLHLIRKGSGWMMRTGFLEVEQVGYTDWIEGIDGTLYWDGPLYWNGHALEWSSMLEEGRCRISVSQGDLLTNSSDMTMIQKLQGSLSFDGKSGAKWALSCMYGTQKLEGEGKGFFDSLKECWVESQFRSGKTILDIQGKEQGDQFAWTIDVQNLTHDLVSLIQEGALLFSVFEVPWSMTHGSIHGSCMVLCGAHPTQWEITEAFLDKVSIDYGQMKLYCDTFSLTEGKYQLQGASWVFQEKLSGTNWKGEGSFDCHRQGSSFGFSGICEGNVGDLAILCHLEEKESAIAIQLQTKGGLVSSLDLTARLEEDGLSFLVQNGGGNFSSWIGFENLKMEGRIDRYGVSCFDVRGLLRPMDLEKTISFYAPIVQTEGKFDLRLEQPCFEILRCSGTASQGEILFDLQKSHILGSRPEEAMVAFDKTSLLQARVNWTFPFRLYSFFSDQKQPFLEEASVLCNLSYDVSELLHFACHVATQIPLSLEVVQKDHGSIHWQFEAKDEGKLKGIWVFSPDGLIWEEGSGSWRDILTMEFIGKSRSFKDMHFDVSAIQMNFSEPLQGVFFGKGTLDYQGVLEANLEIAPCSIQSRGWTLDNIDPLHLSYSSKQGFSCEGLHFFLSHLGLFSEKGEFQVACFSFDPNNPKYFFHEAQFHFPFEMSLSFLETMQQEYASFWEGANVIKNLNFGFIRPELQSDFAQIFASGVEAKGVSSPLARRRNEKMSKALEYQTNKSEVEVKKEILLSPSQRCICKGVADCVLEKTGMQSYTIREMELESPEETYRMQNGFVTVSPHRIKTVFEWENHHATIPIEIDAYFSQDAPLQGRCAIDHTLFVDWKYQDQLFLESIEGSCRGMDASFRLEGESLIGNAKINGNAFRLLLPRKLSQVFDELKIGQGYELMGRLVFGKKGLAFQGTLNGKEAELFGFQIRNILGTVEWDEDHFSIDHLYFSDLAGSLKAETVIAMGKGQQPWTLSIPLITVTELRPGLLRTVGSPKREISPLVVRELKIHNFQGLVEDSNTYTAQGELYFINSYKRGKSILELPSDFFSRILGLDLDLLVPVCGTLKYHLRDGFFHFTDLEDAYSENQRSKFFLVFTEDSPKMDLDWNLHILIQMKQFVLFKFTEAFIISVTGQLEDPKFNLQRKK